MKKHSNKQIFFYLMIIGIGILATNGLVLADADWNYTTWVDRGVGYTAPEGGDAYYPSVIYDPYGFGTGNPEYAMWYSDGIGSFFLSTSTDGVLWGGPTTMTGLTNIHHVQVLYDADCFGSVPCDVMANKYRVWFWDMGAPTIYSISSMATAESVDGINWDNKIEVTQNLDAKLIQSPDSGLGWNRGTYGPVSIFYQPNATNIGTEPWDYKYVMYYNGTDGGHEDTGLAYSTDGLYWSAYATNPVLSHSGTGGDEAWNCVSAVYGTIFRDLLGYHFFYSGSGQDNGSGECVSSASFTGIGHASSIDGKIWAKDIGQIFKINDEAPYRSGRVYTPSVIDDGSDILRMYFSVKDSVGGPKKIGYATFIKPAFLHVVKNVVNDNGGTATSSDFIIHVKNTGDVSNSPTAGTTTPGTLYALSAGTYTLGEDINALYAQRFGLDCPDGNVTLAPGDNKTCTLINTDIPPSLVVIPTPIISAESQIGGRRHPPLYQVVAPLTAISEVPNFPDTGEEKQNIVSEKLSLPPVLPPIQDVAENPPLFDVISEPVQLAQHGPTFSVVFLAIVEIAFISLIFFTLKRFKNCKLNKK